MMIIYHFKQRITVIEKKTETTIDILNNLAKEIGSLRNTITIIVREQSRQQGPPPGFVEQFFLSQGGSPFNTLSSRMVYGNGDDEDEFPGSGIQREVNNITIDLNEENVEIDHLEIGGTETENTNKIILLDNVEMGDEDSDEDDDDGDEDDHEDSDEEDNDDLDEDSDEDPELSNSVIAQETAITIEKIVVSDEESEPEPKPTPVGQPDEVASASAAPESPALDYSKLTTSQLKNIVLDKKLYDGNVNKLKRSELLKRLQ